MRVDRILALADRLERLPVEADERGFSMHFYDHERLTDGTDDDVVDLSGHDCRSVSCIAGWTCVLHQEGVMHRTVLDSALHLLDLDYDRHCSLFNPHGHPAAWDATPVQAAAVLRHLAATGIVDWGVVGLASDPEEYST